MKRRLFNLLFVFLVFGLITSSNVYSEKLDYTYDMTFVIEGKKLSVPVTKKEEKDPNAAKRAFLKVAQEGGIVIGKKDLPGYIKQITGEPIIFAEKKPIQIPYQKCGNDKAVQLVKVDTEKWSINWKWDNKGGVWCGWGTESLPLSDLSNYLNGYLIIKFTGTYEGDAPEVKFIDFSDNHTTLVGFRPFISGDPTKGAIVKIPIRKFFGNDKDFYSADPTKIRTLQFDAAYSSGMGRIKISYIGLSMK